MAGTSDAWKTNLIVANAMRGLYRGCAVPGAGLRPTLHTDGSPDSTANPSALHMGATKEGAKVLVKPTFQGFGVDEFRSPIVRNLDAVEMGIGGELVGVTDMQLAAYLLPGVGSRSAASGYDYVTIGSKAIAYDCILGTWVLQEDASKYGWVQLYNAINDPGVEFAISRKTLGFTPVSFVATEVTSRAAADTLGQYGKQA